MLKPLVGGATPLPKPRPPRPPTKLLKSVQTPPIPAPFRCPFHLHPAQPPAIPPNRAKPLYHLKETPKFFIFSGHFESARQPPNRPPTP